MSRTIFLNAALFQVGWFACILGGNLIALSSAIIILLCHWFFISKDLAEWRVIALIAFVGIVIDSALFAAGFFSDGSQRVIAPLWLMCLWVIFPTTLKHSFVWLHQRPLLAIVLGAIAGPLSYLAGIKLGAVSLGIGQLWAMLVLGVIWAVLFPVSIWLMTSNRRALA